MGSGSAGRFTQGDVEVLREQARKRLAQSQNEASINAFLQQELAEINNRDVELINRRLDQIGEILGDRIELDRLLLGGSVAKHTYVDGLSDVDSLAILSGTFPRPEDAMLAIREYLEERLPFGEIENIRTGNLAVSVEYRDGNVIQILPAKQQGGEVTISSADGTHWTDIDPRRFAQRLTEANQRQGGSVVPAVKLAKSVLASKLGAKTPTGYHIEALAVAAFRDYTGPRTPSAMLTRLVESASRNVLHRIRDVTGQSAYVDEYLGEMESGSRKSLAAELAQIARDLSKGSISDWRAMFE